MKKFKKILCKTVIGIIAGAVVLANLYMLGSLISELFKDPVKNKTTPFEVGE